MEQIENFPRLLTLRPINDSLGYSDRWKHKKTRERLRKILRKTENALGKQSRNQRTHRTKVFHSDSLMAPNLMAMQCLRSTATYRATSPQQATLNMEKVQLGIISCIKTVAVLKWLVVFSRNKILWFLQFFEPFYTFNAPTLCLLPTSRLTEICEVWCLSKTTLCYCYFEVITWKIYCNYFKVLTLDILSGYTTWFSFLIKF